MEEMLIYIMNYLEPNKHYRFDTDDEVLIDCETNKKYTLDGFKNAAIFKMYDLVRIAKHLDRAGEAAQRLTNTRIME